MWAALLVLTTASASAPAAAGERLDPFDHTQPLPSLPAALLRVDPGRPARLPALEPEPLWVADPSDGTVPIWSFRRWTPLLFILGVAAGLRFGVESPDEARWDSRNGFDESARRGLRISSGSGRKTANTLSDVFLATNAALLVTDWWLERDTYSPLESFRVDTMWIMGGTIFTKGMKLAVARERPFVRGCETGAVTEGCDLSSEIYQSFYSGHTSMSSTMAGLLCARRFGRPERSAADYWACAGASSLAITTGFMRIAADKHWLTDALVGWGTGAVFGYLLPTWFKYGNPDAAYGLHRRPVSHLVAPIATTRLWGLRYQLRW